MVPYRLFNRYQDEGWKELIGEEYDSYVKACKRAKKLSADAINYGMVSVVDCNGVKVRTFWAGEGRQ